MSKQQKIYILIGFFVILVASIFAAGLPYLAGFLTTQSQPANLRPQPPPIVRQQLPQPPPPTKIEQGLPSAAEFDLSTDIGKFEYQINQLLMAKDFAQIDKTAREIRASKKRFKNGKWAISRFYDGLTNIYKSDGQEFQTDALWKERIELLKSWKQKFPDSAAARIALANTYISYGWFTRGTGFSGNVPEENFKILSERLTMAENELFEARSLNEKCPGWFEVKLTLANLSGASPAEFDELFNEAVSFEPNYFVYYRIKSDSLKPKWGGSEIAWKKYVDSIPNILAQHNSDEGNIMYLLILLSNMQDNSIIRDYSVFSKENVRQGFAEISKKHGIDDFLLNKYALFCIMTVDVPAAKEAMEKIGNNPDPDVWSKEKFFNMKKLLYEKLSSEVNSTKSF